MRLEQISSDQVKVFLTFDDLKERGLKKEDLWFDRPNVHELFRDMVLEAEQLGFQADRSLSVEVYALPAQGMVVHISKAPVEDADEDYIEMDIMVDERHDIMFQFETFEDVLGACQSLYPIGIRGGRLYSKDQMFYLYFPKRLEIPVALDRFIALTSEYGEASPVSPVLLKEHGKQLMQEYAVHQLYTTFF
ncbi:adapter protein MecA 1/2 [Salsuginibacillus halophilus]|uniref:Adapter protein MecA 1/2 n=1 Tax=Salsuginibacillus halophilus TaxID=517424 RepID=A0A2P8HWC3_9BACI|nr:adaptor protein MecA [Salsuginibacillus halophilus]PSL50465.1 adapter protein MecA 1/2 [Salsuginibacillus halophilus]